MSDSSVDFVEEEVVKLSHEEILAMMRKDLDSGQRIRPLTDDERVIYANAAMNITTRLPAFRDAVAILHPFVDASAETCYVDKHGRVGLSYFFLYAINGEARATWLLHEAMHVMNSHFSRAATANIAHREMNICGDLEINTTLSTTRWAVLDNLLLPEKYGYDKFKTLEYYANLRLSEDGKEDSIDGAGEGKGEAGDSGSSSSQNSDDSGAEGDSGNSGSAGDNDSEGAEGNSSSGQAQKSFEEDIQDRLARDMKKGEKGPGGDGESIDQSCDQATESRSYEADAQDIERSSESKQEIARQNTRARIKDNINSSQARGRNASSNEFYERVLAHMAPAKVDWREVFRSAVAKAFGEKSVGRSVPSYTRVNRRYTQGNIIFPGNVDIQPTAMIAVDTSGSMGQQDFAVTLTEIQEITEKAVRSRNGIPMFSVDTSIHNIKTCRSVKELDLQGGGGTDMALAFKYANELPRKSQPDIFILATDGHVYWEEIAAELRNARYIPIILVTDAKMEHVPGEMFNIAKIIPIGENNT